MFGIHVLRNCTLDLGTLNIAVIYIPVCVYIYLCSLAIECYKQKVNLTPVSWSPKSQGWCIYVKPKSYWGRKCYPQFSEGADSPERQAALCVRQELLTAPAWRSAAQGVTKGFAWGSALTHQWCTLTQNPLISRQAGCYKFFLPLLY